jgi:hypothetical protein
MLCGTLSHATYSLRTLSVPKCLSLENRVSPRFPDDVPKWTEGVGLKDREDKDGWQVVDGQVQVHGGLLLAHLGMLSCCREKKKRHARPKVRMMAHL